MSKTQRSRHIVATALGAVTLHTGDAASQLVTDAEPMEACEVLRLGDGLDVPEWLAFTRAPGLMVDAMGRVHVRAGQVAAVTVLDSDGGFVRTIGGKGEGPGEFVAIGATGFVGDTLWLQNWPMLHTSFLDSTGTHLKTEADHGPPITGPQTQGTSIPLAGGQGFYIPAAGGHDEARVRLPMTVGSRSDASRDTLAFKFDVTDMRIGGVGVFYYSATVTPPIHRIDPEGNGVVIADWVPDRPETVTIRRFDEYGRLMREIAIGAELHPIPPSAKRGFIEEGMKKAKGPYESARQRGQKVPGSLRAAVEEGLLLPDYYAPVQSMLLTRSGRVWLRETTKADAHEGQWVVLVSMAIENVRVVAIENVRVG
ncbi:MAG: hypothetical protein OXG58_05260, partial [Gemmatimonadetes bacterium]|nr:hypothetical protein [Gemmatimonadota bacterium]